LFPNGLSYRGLNTQQGAGHSRYLEQWAQSRFLQWIEVGARSGARIPPFARAHFRWQTTHDLTSKEGLVPLTPPTQKSAVHCTQPPAGEHHSKKAGDARQSPKRHQRQHTHKRHATPAPAHPTPANSGLLRTACAPASTYSKGSCVV
jgi:hypothetical protein